MKIPSNPTEMIVVNEDTIEVLDSPLLIKGISRIVDVCSCPVTNRIAFSTIGPRVQCWDVLTGLNLISSHEEDVYQNLCFSFDGRFVFGSTYTTIKRWDLETQESSTIASMQPRITFMMCVQDGIGFVSGGRLMLLDDNGVRELYPDVRGFYACPDGSMIVVSETNSLTIVQDGFESVGLNHYCTEGVLSDDGSIFVFVEYGTTVVVLDMITRTILRSRCIVLDEDERQSVFFIELSPDKTYISIEFSMGIDSDVFILRTQDLEILYRNNFCPIRFIEYKFTSDSTGLMFYNDYDRELATMDLEDFKIVSSVHRERKVRFLIPIRNSVILM
jgi:WD40 repeat protein